MKNFTKIEQIPFYYKFILLTEYENEFIEDIKKQNEMKELEKFSQNISKLISSQENKVIKPTKKKKKFDKQFVPKKESLKELKNTLVDLEKKKKENKDELLKINEKIELLEENEKMIRQNLEKLNSVVQNFENNSLLSNLNYSIEEQIENIHKIVQKSREIKNTIHFEQSSSSETKETKNHLKIQMVKKKKKGHSKEKNENCFGSFSKSI